jgi:hypothetical protein
VNSKVLRGKYTLLREAFIDELFITCLLYVHNAGEDFKILLCIKKPLATAYFPK